MLSRLTKKRTTGCTCQFCSFEAEARMPVPLLLRDVQNVKFSVWLVGDEDLRVKWDKDGSVFRYSTIQEVISGANEHLQLAIAAEDVPVIIDNIRVPSSRDRFVRFTNVDSLRPARDGAKPQYGGVLCSSVSMAKKTKLLEAPANVSNPAEPETKRARPSPTAAMKTETDTNNDDAAPAAVPLDEFVDDDHPDRANLVELLTSDKEIWDSQFVQQVLCAGARPPLLSHFRIPSANENVSMLQCVFRKPSGGTVSVKVPRGIVLLSYKL